MVLVSSPEGQGLGLGLEFFCSGLVNKTGNWYDKVVTSVINREIIFTLSYYFIKIGDIS